MGKLTLIRHGKAGDLHGEYDLLSPTGVKQARALGAFWLAQGKHPDRVFTGRLRRQIVTAAEVGAQFGAAGIPWPEPEILPGLDEYPAAEIVRELIPRLAEADTAFAVLAETVRVEEPGSAAHSHALARLIEAALDAWVSGRLEHPNVAPWREFCTTVRQTLDFLTHGNERGQEIVAFTSGGPIGVCVQTLVEAPDRMANTLCWRIINASLTEIRFDSGARRSLDTFNATPHLPDPALRTLR